MNTQKCLTSACRYCRFYQPEGLHLGSCQQLSVPVRSDWKACQLAMPAFSPTWEELEDLLPTTDEAIPVTPTVLTKLEREVNSRERMESNLNSLSSMKELEIFTWSDQVSG